MLAGEDIPHLLQTLLVGVEHAICRVPLDELTYPTQYDNNVTVSNSIDKCESDHTTQLVDEHTESNSKHRELITKNNSINKKYISASKRITSNGILHENGTSNTNNNDIVDDEINNLNEHSTKFDDGNLSITGTSSTLPLFCLGGSFPHIDSDEESGDDTRKIQSGKLQLFIIIIIIIIFFMFSHFKIY
jgi:hypothetical protein